MCGALLLQKPARQARQKGRQDNHFHWIREKRKGPERLSSLAKAAQEFVSENTDVGLVALGSLYTLEGCVSPSRLVRTGSSHMIFHLLITGLVFHRGTLSTREVRLYVLTISESTGLVT